MGQLSERVAAFWDRVQTSSFPALEAKGLRLDVPGAGAE